MRCLAAQNKLYVLVSSMCFISPFNGSVDILGVPAVLHFPTFLVADTTVHCVAERNLYGSEEASWEAHHLRQRHQCLT